MLGSTNSSVFAMGLLRRKIRRRASLRGRLRPDDRTLERYDMSIRFRRRAGILVLAIGCIVLSNSTGCSDIEVSSHYAPSEALTALPKSYDWASLSQGQSEFWNQRTELRDMVNAAIESRFAEKGYTRQSGAQPGFYVRLNATKEARTDSGVNPHGEVYEKIALIMDVINPATNRTLWRGAATARLDAAANPEQRRNRIHQAAHMLVDRFADNNK